MGNLGLTNLTIRHMVCRALYGDNRLVDNPDLITQDDTVVRLFWALPCVPAARMIELENKTAATFQKKTAAAGHFKNDNQTAAVTPSDLLIVLFRPGTLRASTGKPVCIR